MYAAIEDLATWLAHNNPEICTDEFPEAGLLCDYRENNGLRNITKVAHVLFGEIDFNTCSSGF